ncbi:MAG TPA: tRNA (adenosine(37)-N6)-dimethylallyltransferase MiaA, partial [Naasia sp.]
MTPPPLLAIVGPTGTGKTALSLGVAETLLARGRPAHIVNADAMQLYRGMDVGTAKLPESERRGIPHSLFDVLDPTETSTVADFQPRAREVIASIREQGAVPLLVGGSGLYVSAVIHDFRFPGTDPAVRARLEAELAAAGPALLWQRLRAADPAAAAAIDPGNGRRVMRALEVIELTGAPYGASLPEKSPYWVPTRLVYVDVAQDERDLLKQRLAERAREMWRSGLVDEVRGLLPGLREGTTAARAIGYAQALAVLDGTMTEEEGIEETIRLTWRYVRRQRSWFGRYPDAVRLRAGDPDLVDRVLALVDAG